jgi:hypothetical protein
MPRVIFREGKPNVRIIKYPDAVRTSWEAVRKLIPPLWEGKKAFYRLWEEEEEEEEGESDSPEIDAVLHIGMLDKPHEAFRLERNGYKSGYDLADADGKYPTDGDKTDDGTWGQTPEKLSTDTDLDAIHKRVSAELSVSNLILLLQPCGLTCSLPNWLFRMSPWSLPKTTPDSFADTFITRLLSAATTKVRREDWFSSTCPSSMKAKAFKPASG